ncbi:lipoprotein [Oceanobacillus picturae]|uniref:Lipoprotein n=1 Tax=Oceanobacillus picturae TaxID=171693 RepID=A0A0U9HH39_9BACI|nr:triple tyrosine motif-containing protein [Oceanobacillus picturae]GAQ19560.1 lipoprotein [Oceanobacillus picturae]
MGKKLIVLIVAALLLISGCGNDTQEDTDSTNSNKSKPEFVKLIINKRDSSEFYVVATAEGSQLSYAYYVYKGDELLEKKSYVKDAHFSYQVKEAGTYKVKVYIKDKDENVASKYTNEIEVE